MNAVAIVDSGVANLASMTRSLRSLGVSTAVTSDPSEVEAAERVVLPGVGHFDAAMRRLREHGLHRALESHVDEGRPLLAVCLGLQLLCEASEESPDTPGLALLPGRCRALTGAVRVPHLGWNGVVADTGCRLLEDGNAAFANSYALTQVPPGWSAAWTRHGRPFVAALERGNVLACQFHPELSGRYGRQLLARWLEDRPRVTTATSPLPRLSRRIIPCLDVKDGRVVKGIRFQGLRDSGDPAERAELYERQGADEIVLLDVAASPRRRTTQLDTVRRVRARLAIPLTVGGGVRSPEDARALLAAGADKVAVNTAAVARPELVTELAAELGTQCVVLAIDARRRVNGWEVLVRGGHDGVDRDAVRWAAEGARAGAGEILLTSWDRDGTQTGCDLELLRAVGDQVGVPVIASGGIGTRRHVAEAFDAGADAALAATIFHDDRDSVARVKSFLAAEGYEVRV
jgi:imidazole glycerol phosphate synthase glutamine amidotransferase subunit